MVAISYTGVDLSTWKLTDVDHGGIFMEEGALAVLRGVDGEPLSGALRLVAVDRDLEARFIRRINDTMARWRAAWSPREWGTLRVSGPRGESFAQVRLASPIPDLTTVDPEGFEAFEQQVIGKTSRWLRARSANLPWSTVVNGGDHEIWPRVKWSKGGKLTLPSGAAYDLPTVAAPRTIWLNPALGCKITDDAGARDDDLWRSLRGNIFPEVVPAGQSRVFGIPVGATILWEDELEDPLW